MTNKLKQITGKEFAKKVITGERDFSKISINDKYFIAPELEKELCDYLKKQNWKESPLILDNSKIEKLIMHEVYLPYIQAKNAEFNFGSLELCDFNNSNFTNTQLYGNSIQHCNFNNSVFSGGSIHSYNYLNRNDFKNCNFKNGRFIGNTMNCVFDGSDFENLEGSLKMMWEGSLMGIKNLEKSKFNKVCCENVYIDDKNKEILLKIIERNSFRQNKLEKGVK